MASAIDRLYIFRSRLIPGRTSVEDAHSELQGLTVALANEMHRTWFCYLPREKAQLQRDAPGEWSKVVAVFPTIQPEIESAHRCYSVGADTACVFHLMRAMETAVRKLSRRLRVTITPQTTWRQMTGSMDSKIKAMPEKTFRQKDKKNDWEEARANLHHVGSVWRNKTMHPAKSYTPSQAKEILQATRVFMISLCAL
jgi:hypothetical protein